MLRQRVLTALVLALLLVWLLFFQDALAWRVFVLVAGALAADEWAGLARLDRPWRLVFAVLTACVAGLLLGLSDAFRDWGTGLLALAVAFWALAVPTMLLRGWRVPAGAAFLLTGWVVLLPTMLALVRLHALGVMVLLAGMAVCWVSDVCAYFVGRAVGRHRLAPAISPGKTWEGVVGALIGVTLFGLWLGMAPAPAALGALQAEAGGAWIPLLLLLAVLGIEGDLFESWLKRCAGVKDSGWILPGHGGVLDRIDALTAALPAAALMIDLAAAGRHP